MVSQFPSLQRIGRLVEELSSMLIKEQLVEDFYRIFLRYGSLMKAIEVD